MEKALLSGLHKVERFRCNWSQLKARVKTGWNMSCSTSISDELRLVFLSILCFDVIRTYAVKIWAIYDSLVSYNQTKRANHEVSKFVISSFRHTPTAVTTRKELKLRILLGKAERKWNVTWCRGCRSCNEHRRSASTAKIWKQNMSH